MIFSCVRAPEKGSYGDSAHPQGGGIGFLDDWRRLNVAITRYHIYLYLVVQITIIYIRLIVMVAALLLCFVLFSLVLSTLCTVSTYDTVLKR